MKASLWVGLYAEKHVDLLTFQTVVKEVTRFAKEDNTNPHTTTQTPLSAQKMIHLITFYY
jgi:hypothetical protein